jgi:hypothetical protein
MKKVQIFEDGSIAIHDGPQALEMDIVPITKEGKFLKLTEEFEATGENEELENLRKTKNIKDLRRFGVKKLYKRGNNIKEDELRDKKVEAIISMKGS